MKLCITILKQEELIEDVVKKLKRKNIKNITTIHSTSIVDSNYKSKKMDTIIGSLRHLIDYGNDESIIVLNIVNKEQVTDIVETLKETVNEKQYIFFTIEISDFEGTLA